MDAESVEAGQEGEAEAEAEKMEAKVGEAGEATAQTGEAAGPFRGVIQEAAAGAGARAAAAAAAPAGETGAASPGALVQELLGAALTGDHIAAGREVIFMQAAKYCIRACR